MKKISNEDACATRTARTNIQTDSNLRGYWAESFAERWLKTQGLTPHTQNYTRRLGEIDLVMRDDLSNTWVFVEVKYRANGAMVSGVDAITANKQRKLYRTAELFLQQINDQTSAARIDVLVISPGNNQPTAQPIDFSACDSPHRIEQVAGHHLLWIQNAIDG